MEVAQESKVYTGKWKHTSWNTKLLLFLPSSGASQQGWHMPWPLLKGMERQNIGAENFNDHWGIPNIFQIIPFALPLKENPFPAGGCPSVLLEEMVTKENLMNACEERSVEEIGLENEEDIGDWYPALGRKLEDGNVWELFVITGAKVGIIFLDMTDVLKPVEMGCGVGEELRKFLLRWVGRINDDEVVLATVLLLNTIVVIGVMDVVALLWPAVHRTQI